MSRTSILRSPEIDNKVHARLLNWGRWLRYDIGDIGFPHKSPFVIEPSKGAMIEDADAEEIDRVVAGIGASPSKHGKVLAFVLKVEYAERSEAMSTAVEQRAKDVAIKWGIQCSKTKYKELLKEARLCVQGRLELV